MNELVHRMTAAGELSMLDFLERVRSGSLEATPLHLLTDPVASSEVAKAVSVSTLPLSNRLELGQYLVNTLAPMGRREISLDRGVWNWLSLFYFDFFCPQAADGSRKVLRNELYVLDSNYLRYYKNLVRTTWMAVLEHGVYAEILFATKKGIRTDIEETLAASQQVFGNKTIIHAANELYLDKASRLPKRGAAGKGDGSPRRLTSILQQLSLTYDIQSCTVSQLFALLPAEFDRFKRDSKKSMAATAAAAA